ncbi:peptidoglycan-binding domain-containing protein [Streptomyces beigongshangae]|uniref:peptidoglycan-binding domain-containing protein n=1 Tax=Streptomyces beigongshangae TaxID=2841597 RepID=UPI001C84C44F|nr:peptidoglycan-binding domain-containing protein [Streptomyces sp. REN17]
MTVKRRRYLGAVLASLLGCALLSAPVTALGSGPDGPGRQESATHTAPHVMNAVNGEWRLCAYTGGHPELGEGHANDAVGHLQCVLNQVYGYTSVVADKIFGSTTRAAVVDFQQSVGLTADGFVGPRTWAALHP